MPKYMRWQPFRARATSPARVRSPTTTSAPIARSASDRSSSLRTSARTGRPRRRRISTTSRPTPPTRPAAPVTRIGASIDMDATPSLGKVVVLTETDGPPVTVKTSSRNPSVVVPDQAAPTGGSRNLIAASEPSTMKAANAMSCVIAKGGADCVGASILRTGTF